MGRRSEWREEALGADPGVGAEEEGHHDGLDAADGVDEGEENELIELDRRGGNGRGLEREVHRRRLCDRATPGAHADLSPKELTNDLWVVGEDAGGLTRTYGLARVGSLELHSGEGDAGLTGDCRRVLACCEQGSGESVPVADVERVDSTQEHLPPLADVDENNRRLVPVDLHAAHSEVDVDGLVGLAVGADEGGREGVRGPGEGERRVARKGGGATRSVHFWRTAFLNGGCLTQI